MNHPGDCYRMYNPRTLKVYETQDVIFLKRMYHKKPKAAKETGTVIKFLDDDIQENEEELLMNDNQDNSNVVNVDDINDGPTPGPWTTVTRSERVCF
jgi:hypothetical protein